MIPKPGSQQQQKLASPDKAIIPTSPYKVAIIKRGSTCTILNNHFCTKLNGHLYMMTYLFNTMIIILFYPSLENGLLEIL